MSILHDVRSGIRGFKGGGRKNGRKWVEKRGVGIYINKD